MKKFFIIWIGQVFSIIGSSIVTFALVWYLTRETGSATVLATATIIALLPALVLMPFIGAWVDRWNRKRIIIIADLSIALATAGLAVLFYLDVIQIWHIYAFTLLRSIGGAFHGPAMMATIPLLVPEKYLVRVNSLNQMLMGGMNIVTPPLGALLIELLPMQSVLAIDVLTALAAVGCLLIVAIPQPARVYQNGKTTVFMDIKEGFRFIWSWPGLVALILCAAVANLFMTPVSSLSPIMVTQYFGRGVVELGWAQSFLGVGMIAGGLILSAWGGFKKRIMTSIAGMFLVGAAVCTAGLIPPSLFVLYMVCFGLLGLAIPVSNSPIMAIFQVVVPREMQGRVFTLVGTATMAAAPLGLVIAGPLSDAIGVQTVYVIAGIVVLAIALFQTSFPAIRNIESQKSSFSQPAAPEKV